LFLNSPPSGAKTEIIRSLASDPGTFFLSDLTARTLASGQKKGQGSLLLKLPSHCVLALKDFGSILSKRAEERAEIIQQLREIFDGSYHKEFGSGVTIDWQGKWGLIAGTTPIIDRHQPVMEAADPAMARVKLSAH
jgi:hypothetical protein